MRRKFGQRRHADTPLAKAIAKLDAVLSVLVRTHYIEIGCFTCGRQMREITEGDCGHFRRRECMSTRFDVRNLGLQCKKCNRFAGGRPYEFGLKLDEIWGNGTARQMFDESRRIKRWEVGELEQLTSAAKIGWLAYAHLYAALSTASRRVSASDET